MGERPYLMIEPDLMLWREALDRMQGQSRECINNGLLSHGFLGFAENLQKSLELIRPGMKLST